MAEKFDVSIFIKLYDSASQSLSNIGSKIRSLETPLRSLSDKFRDVGTKLTFGFALPVGLLGYKALKAAGEVEDMADAVNLFTKSASDAQKIMRDIDKLNVVLPFPVSQTELAAQKLLRFGITAKDLLPTMRMLGEISVGSKTDLISLVEVYGRTLQLNKFDTRVLRELVMKNIPVIESLMKITGKSREEILKLINAGVGKSKDLVKAFQQMTSSSGIFFNQIDKNKDDIDALFAGLTNSFSRLMRALGTEIKIGLKLEENIPVATKWINELADGLGKLVTENSGLIKFGAVLVGITAALGPLMLGISALVGVIATLVGASAPVLVITGAIVGLGTAIAALIAWGPKLKEFFKGIGDSVAGYFSNKFDKIKGLIDRISSSSMPKVNVPTTQSFPMPSMKSVPISPFAPEKGQTDINIKLTAPNGMGASVTDVKNRGKGARVDFIANSYLGNTQMIPGLR